MPKSAMIIIKILNMPLEGLKLIGFKIEKLRHRHYLLKNRLAAIRKKIAKYDGWEKIIKF